MHQEGGRVATAASWVHISGGVYYAVTVQNVGGGGLLGMRDGGSGSGGDDIYGSGGMKGCVSGREDVGGGGVGGGGGRGDVSGGSSRYTTRGSLSTLWTDTVRETLRPLSRDSL